MLREDLLWGVLFWFGSILWLALFFVVPAFRIGWYIMPVGVLVSLLVLVKNIKSTELPYYLWLGIIWMRIVLGMDYLLIFPLPPPSGGYYKLDGYLYYVRTLLLPWLAGWWKKTASFG